MAIPPKTPLLTLMSVEAQHVAEIRKTLTMSANRIDKEIKALAKGGNPITLMQAQAQRAAIGSFLKQDFTYIQQSIEVATKGAVQAASLVTSQYENQLLQAVMSPTMMKQLATSEALRASSGFEAMIRRVEGSSYLPLSKSVYKTQQMTLGWVDKKINQALLSGWTASQLAKEIKGMIDPNVPGGVSYAANRLARTEINNAFHASSAKRYEDSPIVEGIDWHLSSSHPEGDVCDDLAAGSPYKKKNVPQKPHPFCYCYITPALPSEKDFLDNLFAGKYGDGKYEAAVKADPDPTFNQLAKFYKIKGSVLEKSGATPGQMSAYLGGLKPGDISAIRAFIKNGDDAVLKGLWKKASSITNAELATFKKMAAADLKKIINVSSKPLTPKVASTPKPTAAPKTAPAPKAPATATPPVKELSATEKWLGKTAPKKPVAPTSPKTYGDKAFAEWEKKVSERFTAFAKSTGNYKTDIKQSLNWPKFENVMKKNNMADLKFLLEGKYIDQKLYDEAIAAMKLAKSIDPADAAAFKTATEAYAKNIARFDKDIADWREINGITSSAKGLDDALRHKTNSDGVSWADKNLKVATGENRDAAKKYTGSSYSSWNNALREAKGEVPKGTWGTQTKKLDAAMAPVPEDVIVHRGTNWNEFLLGGERKMSIPPPPPSDLIGSVQTNYGYMSTSVGNSAAFGGQVKLEIMIPEGHGASWVMPFSNYASERELLLSRNTSLYIHDVYKETESGRWVVKAEVVPDGEDATLWTPISSRK